MKNVLSVSAGWIHPPIRGRRFLRETLQALSGYRFDEVETLAQAVNRDLTNYDALVLYYHHRDDALTEAELNAFRTFVNSGGGVLAVHSATASYKKTPAYFEVLGGRFIGHGPIEPIAIRPSQPDDPIFAGIPPFSVKDELYLHELQPDIRVHFETTHKGRSAPMVWTREPGAGRVCYTCPGHRSASMRVPEVVEIVRRGLAWVSRSAEH